MEEQPQTVEQVLKKYAALSYVNAFSPFLLGDKVAAKFIETALKKSTFSTQELEFIKEILLEAIKACTEVKLLFYLKYRMELDLEFVEAAIKQRNNDNQRDQSNPQ